MQTITCTSSAQFRLYIAIASFAAAVPEWLLRPVMWMASFVTALRNNRADEITALIDAGAGAGTMRSYNGTPPTSANDALSGNTLLSQHDCTDPCAPAASSGVLTFSAIANDSSADASGTPTFVRFLDSDANVVIQLTAGVGSGEVSFTGTITAGQVVTVNTGGTITEGNA